LESADAAEREAWLKAGLHQRLDFVLEWLRAWSNHFSMSRIAKRIDVSRQAISKIRKGEVVPTSRLLIPLAKELGVNYRFLAYGEVDYPQPNQAQEFFAQLPLDLVHWVLAEDPGRVNYARAALELARAADASNVDLRFLQNALRLVQPS
jgi:transcriptional regulator with XRE-family HTH domain